MFQELNGILIDDVKCVAVSPETEHCTDNLKCILCVYKNCTCMCVEVANFFSMWIAIYDK